MKILGISAYYHDSAAALLEDGKIVAAAQEERFSRVKNDESFPQAAIAYCLEEADLDIGDLDAIVFYDKPFLKFERVLQIFMDNSPRGWWQFIMAIPNWLKEKLFIKDQIKKELKIIGEVDWKKTDLLFSKHHLSHAASSFFVSPYKDAAILTIDGVGEWTTASIAQGKDNEIQTLRELHFPDSLGLLYSSLTYFLGFKVNSGEYKVMGLAPYGDEKDKLVRDYLQKLKKIVCIYDDGSISLDQNYFKFTYSFEMIHEAKFESLFGIKRRSEESKIEKEHYSLALALQLLVNEVVIKMAKEAKNLTKSDNLCLAGGVALNCVANGALAEAELFENIYVQPAAGDAGNALGAALAVYHMHYSTPRIIPEGFDLMKNARLGPAFGDKHIERALKNKDLIYTRVTEQDLAQTCAKFLNEGEIIGWFQGRMEFGPRALGGRSILGNPKLKDTQSKLNLRVKKRESFRPFAPIMLEEEFTKYFGRKESSPYMLFVHKLLDEHRKTISIQSDNLIERINEVRSELPAITHLDYSARIQTVNTDNDPLMYSLLLEFKRLSGQGVLVNTSFNLRGEPIVCDPNDAINTFLSTDIDVLVLSNFVIRRENNLDKLEEKVTVKLD